MMARMKRLIIGVALLQSSISCFIGCGKQCTISRHRNEPRYATVYIRDYEFLPRIYLDVGEFGPDSLGLRFEPRQDTILGFRLFRHGRLQYGDQFAWLHIDPRDTAFYGRQSVGAYVHEMIPDEEYSVDRTELWIRLEHQLQTNDILGCWMLVGTPGRRVEVGSLLGDTVQLKLLRPPVFYEESATWQYEWRNTYYLGASGISYENLKVDIFKGPPGSERELSNRNWQDGIEYLQLLGLDLWNRSGDMVPDGVIDNRDEILDLRRGHLHFPHRTPFAPGDVVYSPIAPPGFRLDPQVGAIYRTALPLILRDSSQYYIRVTITLPDTSA